MSESQNSNQQTTIAAVFGAAIFLYVISAGPMAYLIQKLNVPPSKTFVQFIEFCFYPHIALVEKSNTYERYIVWWIDLAG